MMENRMLPLKKFEGTWDKEIKALYVYLNNEEIFFTDEHNATVIVDRDHSGEIVGIEVLLGLPKS